MGFHENIPPPYTGQVEAPKKIEVFVHDFCEYCGKHRNVSLIPMQHGWSWYCFWCQLRYLWRTRSHRKDIYKRIQATRYKAISMDIT